MEALTPHGHQPLYSSVHYYGSSLTSSTSSLLLSQPASSPPSSSIRASSSSSSSPSSYDPPLQNLQYPETKTPQFFNPLPKVSSFDAPLQNPVAKSPQFFNPLRKVPSFAAITAASAFLFLGFCQKGFINKPITLLSSQVSIHESLDEKGDIGFFLGSKPDHAQSVLHLKLEERIPIVHSFNKTTAIDEEAWQVLKAQVLSCSEKLQLVKVGFEEILEKDMHCSKPHHDIVLEYLEMVDKCNSWLKSIKVAMHRCERQNADVKRYLRFFFSKVVARIKVLEGDMVGALKYFKEL